MKASCIFTLFPLLCLIAPADTSAAEVLRYFPATPQNTTLADGSTLKTVDKTGDSPAEITRGKGEVFPNNHWHWQEAFGSGQGDSCGTFLASGKSGNDCPILRTTLTGLKPGSIHEVYGFFWVAGYADDKAVPAGDAQWDIRFGLGLADLLSYSHRNNSGFPGTIGPGNRFRDVVRQCDQPIQPVAAPLVDRLANKRLFRAKLGTAAADAEGSLIVNIDDRPDDSDQAPTCYDGIGVIETAGAKAEIGVGAAGALHLAVRAGDWEMARRELAAKADPNTLDKDGLTPLFYTATYNDREHVNWLLKAGAKPDVERQAHTPLWAAATSGDAELAKTLLAAGAEVPEALVDPAKLAVSYRSPSHLHPAVAAIRSGSVEVLKLLLEQQPKLDLDALFDRGVSQGHLRLDGKENRLGFYESGVSYAIGDAVHYRHPEMAEFLIRHGCRMDGNGTGKSKSPGTAEVPCILLLSAIQARPPMTGVINALAEKGWPMVNTSPLPKILWGGVIPWDGLSCAVAAGEIELAKRFSSGRNDLSEDYLLRLMILADSSGGPAMLNFVKQIAPDIRLDQKRPDKAPKTAKQDEEDAPADASLRMLIPRDHPPAKARTLEGDRVLAVISDPKSEGQGTALAVEASKQPGWKVVERGEIETLLKEREFSDPWSGGKLSVLGDRLSADVLVLVSMLGQGDAAVLRFEAVDVFSGLALMRRHVDAKSLKPAEFSRDFLTKVRSGIQERLEGKGLTAVTLLGLTADEHLGGGRSLEYSLRAGVLGIIDSTPGMISLTRDQMRSIAEEKTFQQSSELWNAAWTIEGGISPAANGRLELGLRLRSLGADHKSHDAKVEGTPEELLRMISDAWTALLKEAGSGASPKVRDSAAVAAEAARLLREAQWLMNVDHDHDHEAIGLLESALLLGANPVSTANYLISARYRTSMLVTSGLVPERMLIPSNPRTLAGADKAASSLDEMLDLMRFAHQCFVKYENINAGQPDSISKIDWIMAYLIGFRGMLCPARMDQSQLALFKQFDKELNDFVRLDTTIRQKGFVSFSWHLPVFYENLDARFYDLVPPLQDALAEWFVKCKSHQDHRRKPTSGMIGSIGSMKLPTVEYPAETAQVAADYWNESSLRWLAARASAYPLSTSEIICRSLERAMKGQQVSYESVRRAEIAFLRSSGAGRAVAARALMQARMAEKMNVETYFYDWIQPQDLERWIPMLLSSDSLYRTGYSDYNERPKNFRSLEVETPLHGRVLLPNLTQHPRPSPDMSLRQDGYRESLHRGYNSEEMSKRVGDTMANGGPNENTKDRLEAAGLLDMCYGMDLRVSIEKRLAPLLSRHDDGAAVIGTLVDLRDKSMANKAAMMTTPIVDPANRNLLWMRLQSVQGWQIPLNRVGVNDSGFVDHPWLVAFDCSDRDFVHRLDLAKCPGLWPQGGAPAVMWNGNVISDYNHAVFGKSSILLGLYWNNRKPGSGPPSQQERLNSSAVVLIDRKTGKTTEVPGLPGGIVFGCGWGGDTIPLATAVGDDFFAFANSDISGNFDNPGPPPCLWQIKPDGSIKMLTKPGRRPELTPFDAMDRREIETLRHDGGRLLASSRGDNYHYYDPQKETWEAAPPWNAFSRHVGDLNRENLHSFLFPQHILQMNDGGEDVYFGGQETKSGRLVWVRKGGKMTELPVDCKIPENYMATFGLSGKLPNKEQDATPIKEAISRGVFHLTILNQTNDHLVIGMSVGGVRHAYQTPVIHCLPFVWMVEKEKVREAIRKIEQAGK